MIFLEVDPVAREVPSGHGLTSLPIAQAWAKALAGKAVFNGAGANNDAWKSEVKETNDALVAAGIDSIYVEFPGKGLIVREGFDESIFFDFWLRHCVETV